MKVEANKDYTFNDDQFLFKYIDLHKLIYFLNTQNLFFSPLIYFDDPLEGISEKILLENHHSTQNAENDNGKENRQNKRRQDDEQALDYRNYLEKVQRKLFASCWFLGTRESLAMWESYSNNDSVALRFKPEHLCKTIIDRFIETDSTDFSTMVHGKVEYFKLSPFDPSDKELKNCGHRFSGFIKDLSYKHEEEFRFLMIQQNQEKQFDFYEFSPGTLKNLDFTIITHPYMEEWKYRNIKMILQNNELQNRLVRSEIPTRRRVFNY